LREAEAQRRFVAIIEARIERHSKRDLDGGRTGSGPTAAGRQRRSRRGNAPEYIPETIWDGEKNAPKIDLAADPDRTRSFQDPGRRARREDPGRPDAYSFDLPKDFELPGGYKWEADPKDPLVAGVKEFAATNKLTQDEVGGLVKLYAPPGQPDQGASRFVQEQTKALGEKATERRAAVNTFIDGMFKKDDPKGAMLKTMLDYAPGVEAMEALIAKAGGVQPRGNPGGADQPNQNAEMAEQIGKVPMGKKLLDLANSQSK
jgi:hypothetical protein